MSEEMTPEEKLKDEIRKSTRALYDFQRMRMQSAGRGLQDAAGKKVDLKPGDLGYLDNLSNRLEDMEKQAEKHLEKLCAQHPMHEWLRSVRGVGPRMEGVLLSEIDIRKCNTISALWRYAGLACVPNEEGVYRAERPVKGEKLHYNAFLKTKMLKVLADSFIKSKSGYKAIYDGKKHRRENQLVSVCMGCNGKGGKCANCEGTGGPAPWGRSKAHRDADARRAMCKEFLSQMWLEWRKVEDLPIRVPYAEEYLGRKHHEPQRVE